MSAEANVAASRRIIEEAWNLGFMHQLGMTPQLAQA